MSILKGYRPSSTLQAMFAVYYGGIWCLFTELDMDLFNSAFVKWVLHDSGSGLNISHPLID